MLPVSAVGAVGAFQQGAAWADLSDQGRLRATGADRVRLLHAICSNDLEGLAPGQGTYAFFLNPQGKIQADSRLFVAADHVLVVCESAVRQSLRDHIESYIIMDDVNLEDVSGQLAVTGLAGPHAAGLLSSVGAEPPSSKLQSSSFPAGLVRRAPVGGHDGFWLETAPGDAPDLRERLERLGAIRASAEARDIARVRRRVPRFGLDFGPDCIPHETQVFSAVSFTKGCYTGQEIVERVRSRGRVRRLLVAVELESPEAPTDRRVVHDGKAVGSLTSLFPISTDGRKWAGFAMVRRAAAAPGTRVTIGTGAATIAAISAP